MPMISSPMSGCTYDGQNHEEGSSWFSGSTPCISCMCVDGVTTCSEIRCLSPCVNFINVPGECCPVCAGEHINSILQCLILQKSNSKTFYSTDCVFEGSVYGPGDSFHPAGDPCQICTCEVCHTFKPQVGEKRLHSHRRKSLYVTNMKKEPFTFSSMVVKDGILTGYDICTFMVEEAL